MLFFMLSGMGVAAAAAAEATGCAPVAAPGCEHGAVGMHFRTPVGDGPGCRPTGRACPAVPIVVPYQTARTPCRARLEHLANGCSVGLVDEASKSFKVLFHAACNEHDRCYMTPGIERETCDETFLQNMIHSCKAYYQEDFRRLAPSPEAYRMAAVFNLPNITFCLAAAATWSGAVKSFGQVFFERSQADAWSRCQAR
jgi:hypothetical protein